MDSTHEVIVTDDAIRAIERGKRVVMHQAAAFALEQPIRTEDGAELTVALAGNFAFWEGILRVLRRAEDQSNDATVYRHVMRCFINSGIVQEGFDG